jgi:urease accessory protein
MVRRSLAFGALLTLLIPSAAFAHTGLGHVTGFASGFAHPLSGLDHVLAMGAVGILAIRLGGRAVWLVPAAFIAMMALGGILGMWGMAVPYVEMAIAASVVILGLTIASSVPLSATAAAVLVGFFALFHGHAHGAEMSAGSAGASYALGFILATAMLHMAGLCLGAALGRSAPRLIGAGGAAMAAAGAGLLSGVL